VAPGADRRQKRAGQSWQRQLVEQVMPFWYDTTVDREDGGYALERAGATKELVTQAQLIWSFAHAYRKGIRDPERDYLEAATHGYRFLLARFRDQYRGYFWQTGRSGHPTDDRKFLYGRVLSRQQRSRRAAPRNRAVSDRARALS
jgi:N-acylglucosamine 2-epimerase